MFPFQWERNALTFPKGSFDTCSLSDERCRREGNEGGESRTDPGALFPHFPLIGRRSTCRLTASSYSARHRKVTMSSEDDRRVELSIETNRRRADGACSQLQRPPLPPFHAHSPSNTHMALVRISVRTTHTVMTYCSNTRPEKPVDFLASCVQIAQSPVVVPCECLLNKF